MNTQRNKMQKAAKVRMFTIINVICIVVSLAISILNILACGHLSDAFYAVVDYTKYLEEFNDASTYLTEEVRFYAVTGDKVHYDNYWNEVNTAKHRDEAITGLQTLGLTPEEQAIVDEMNSLSNSLIPLEEQAMNLVAAGKSDEAIAIVCGDAYNAVVAQIKADFHTMQASINARSQHDVDAQDIFVEVCSYIACVFIIGLFISTIATAYFIKTNLLRPMLKIRSTMTGFAKGELDTPVTLLVDNTEVGQTATLMREFQQFQKEIIADIDYQLAEMANGNFNVSTACAHNYKGNYVNILTSLNKINSTLNATLIEIREAAEQVDDGAEQVSYGAQVLSQGATEQASSTQELAATVGQINEHVQRSGEYAASANEKAVEAGRLTAECNEEMKELVAAMEDISNTSEEISKIIKTIEDIAFQTNILALNAAVEAARAGAAGKGFAVVADEVRNLAAKSAEASKTSSEHIEAAVAAVQRGAKLVENTAANLQSVADIAAEVDTMVGQISASSQEQIISIGQVTTGLDQIASVVTANSATAEESAAASQELSGQSAILKQLVERFKLHDDKE